MGGGDEGFGEVSDGIIKEGWRVVALTQRKYFWGLVCLQQDSYCVSLQSTYSNSSHLRKYIHTFFFQSLYFKKMKVFIDLEDCYQ